ncbi:MAG: GNAT family N-acetyltransferase [Candidatus Tectomicrobia bacterium]|nr:GNAT family N-acetyltransferase [Candidatus Tectomicrobia bacterium]
MEWRRDGYLISTDPALLDINVIHAFLTTSYWATGISHAKVAQSIAYTPIVFGLYEHDSAAARLGRQVGFARAITDKTTFAYLADVFVLAEHRGKGLGKWLVECFLTHPDLQWVRFWTLVTDDAHGLYERYGFQHTPHPEWWMEIIGKPPKGPFPP